MFENISKRETKEERGNAILVAANYNFVCLDVFF